MEIIDKKNSKQWSKLGPRAMFGQFMLEQAEKFDNLMVLSADLGRSSGLDRFKAKFPNKYLSVGISEQNLIGVASGLAKEGYKVFATSFAPFLSMRASEQIRMNLGYMKLPVNIVALGSGISMAYLGNSHFGLEDIAIMRTIPNLNISSPADPGEMRKILYDYLINSHGPSYIRLTGIPGSSLTYSKNYTYKFGKNVSLRKGKDILIIATGSIVAQTLVAAKMLEKLRISTEIINVHTIKPFDKNVIKKLKSYNLIVTVEEHSIIGGLNSIISEKIASNSINTNLVAISLPDKFGPTGTYNYLLDHHGLTAEKIKNKIIKCLKKIKLK
mgnify:FL=1